MRTSSKVIRGALTLLVAGSGWLVSAGCHNSSADAAPPNAAMAGNLQASNGAKPRQGAGGGGVPDMNDYAAPSGVQTGVLPGGRK